VRKGRSAGKTGSEEAGRGRRRGFTGDAFSRRALRDVEMMLSLLV
jgi:hypothetical protein